MKKIFAKFLIAAVCVVMLAGLAAAQGWHWPRQHYRSSKFSDWFVLTYTDVGGPFPEPVMHIQGGGVSFGFYNTPDRALLLTDITDDKQFEPVALTGKALSARIAISATPGATFNYYDNNTGGADPGGFVRFYFQRQDDTTDNIYDPTTGTSYVCGPSDVFDTTKPRCEAQYWWSTVYFDLATLQAAGPKGLTLQVPLNPEFWSDRMGTIGDANATTIGWFNNAVAKADEMGLSFGGGSWYAFGAGVVNGPENPNYTVKVPGGTARATFLMYNFTAKWK